MLNQGCRNQWVADEASDLQESIQFITLELLLAETDVLSPAAHSCRLAAKAGPHLPGALALREASVFESLGRQSSVI